MIKFCVLGSGSRGNAVFVEADGSQFLLDAGLSYPTLAKRLRLINKDINNINAVFITHEHNDHCQAIPGMRKNNAHVSIYSNNEANVLHGQEMDFSKYCVYPFLLSHDVVCHGFRVIDKAGNTFCYVTDTGMITEEAIEFMRGCNAIILEFNHDINMLTESKHPVELQERIASDQGHMLNERSGDVLKEIAWGELRYVVAYHLSETNNNVGLVKYEAKRGLGEFAKAGSIKKGKCEIVITSQNEVTKMMTLI